MITRKIRIVYPKHLETCFIVFVPRAIFKRHAYIHIINFSTKNVGISIIKAFN